MKVLFIESKLKNLKLDLSEEEMQKLPKKLFLAYSIQYKDLAILVRKQLEKNNIKITNFQQVLGCSKITSEYPVLFIGSGRFHSLNLNAQAEEIFLLENNKIMQIPKEEIQKTKNKKQAALLNFLKAENIGILSSTKPGQENIAIALDLKDKLEKKGKNSFLFISNNIDISQFENFPINSWINTACPGLANDNSKIINYSDVIEVI